MTATVDVPRTGRPRTGHPPSWTLVGEASAEWQSRSQAHLALAEALLGDFPAAARAAQRAMDAASPDTAPDVFAAAELALAWICLQTADRPGAERHAAAAATWGPAASARPVLALVRTELGRGHEALPAAPVTRDPPATLVEPLTAREMEVLRHLDALLPTEEIAGCMYISVNTVKTHVRAILRKLSAERRYDAVRRARAMGLL